MVMAGLEALVRELGGACVLPESRGPDVRAVRLDSRAVQPGDLFAALPGGRADGATFVAEALARGAAAVLSPAPLQAPARVPNWVHPAARRVAGEAAAILLGRPSRGLFVVAITGTNGKTTTAHLAAQLLARCGRVPALLGTTGNRLAGGLVLDASHTTPDAPALQGLLARHRQLGGDCVALEASSHALEQERLAGLEVSVAVFTNLTRDHLDYHGDMQRYGAAKRRLFEQLAPGAAAVVNADDPRGEEMAAVARARGARSLTFSTRSRADLTASHAEVDPGGTCCLVHGMGISRTRVKLPLIGRHNVENALAALAAVLLSGASPSDALEGLASVAPAPGRLERVGQGEPVVLVDYAHTPDALERVLETLREVMAREAERRGDHGGRLVCVFGCGGDRDRGKRAPMGAVAAAHSDLAILTSDNPRSEDPQAILAAVRAGTHGGTAEVVVEADRRAAIRLALGRARRGDVVLIAGKGHERVQIVGERVLPFDDREVAAELLQALRAEAGA